MVGCSLHEFSMPVVIVCIITLAADRIWARKETPPVQHGGLLPLLNMKHWVSPLTLHMNFGFGQIKHDILHSSGLVIFCNENCQGMFCLVPDSQFTDTFLDGPARDEMIYETLHHDLNTLPSFPILIFHLIKDTPQASGNGIIPGCCGHYAPSYLAMFVQFERYCIRTFRELIS